MSQSIAEIINPFVDKGLFENAESAVKQLMFDYIIHQIENHQLIINKFEKKYGMNYLQFNKYLKERIKRLSNDKSLHKKIMKEEDDALDWKIASEMMESWLGLKKKTLP
jgi:hypothetical protein